MTGSPSAVVWPCLYKKTLRINLQLVSVTGLVKQAVRIYGNSRYYICVIHLYFSDRNQTTNNQQQLPSYSSSFSSFVSKSFCRT